VLPAHETHARALRVTINAYPHSALLRGLSRAGEVTGRFQKNPKTNTTIETYVMTIASIENLAFSLLDLVALRRKDAAGTKAWRYLPAARETSDNRN